MHSPPGDYYRRLRLSRNASRQEIKAAFRRLARQYHPELHPDQPGATIKYQALREAYEVLIDRVQRQCYDRHQQGFGHSQPSASPQTPSDFYIRGVRYTWARRYRAALNDYNRAIKLDNQFAEAFLRRAQVRYLLNDDPGVLDDCQQAIALNPEEAKTYYYQGIARYRLGYVQSAIAAFTDAIHRDASDACYYYRRGIAYQDLHDLDDAARDLRRAAQLFREQGDLAHYQKLRQYLRPFGTAGRSRFVKLLDKISQQLSLPWSSASRFWPRGKAHRAKMLRGGRASSLKIPVSPLDNPDRNLADSPLSPPQGTTINRSKETSANTSPPITPSKGTPAIPRRRDKRRWPLFHTPRQGNWTPGISSRPDPNTLCPQPRGHLLSGCARVLTLLSNPAGEMVPLYNQLSHHQVTMVGYGLAVLANLIFVLGAMQHMLTNSWLVASWFWASGGLMFVTMVLAVEIARVCLGIRSLWVADIFILGTAMVPLGLLAVMSAIIQRADGTLHLVLILSAAIWAVSHSLLTIHSGLVRIHRFPLKMAVWFAPLVLALGLSAGIGTWEIMSLAI